MSATYAITYSRTHTATFVSDNIRNVLRDIVRESGLDPAKLMDDWQTLGKAAKTWLESGHLYEVVIEFFIPGSSVASARWDIPINYDGSGDDNDMWYSKEHLLRTIAKATKPPANALYRIILRVRPGAVHVDGMGDTELKSVNGLVSRNAGTAIATPDIMAGLRYWRAA